MHRGRLLTFSTQVVPLVPRHALSQAVLLACLSLTLVPSIARAQGAAVPSPVMRYDIAAGSLDQVLNRFAAQAGILLVIDGGLTAGKTSAGLSGSYSVRDGFATILTDSGLEVVAQPTGGYALRRLSVPATTASIAAAGETTLPAVRVTAPAQPGELPTPFAGGQVASGGRLGVLGNTDLMDAPFNITSYTAELIENQQARSVAAVLANDPSVREAATSSAPGQYLLIRGFVSQEASVYFNGLAGMAPNNRSSTEMAERVELLKGASAAINGMVPDGSVGGAVMMVPKRAADTPLTRGGVDYGTRGQWGTRLEVGRRFGENNAWGIRVNGVVRDGESNIEGRDQRTRLGSLALDYRSNRLRAALDLYDQDDARDGTDYYVLRQWHGVLGQLPLERRPHVGRCRGACPRADRTDLAPHQPRSDRVQAHHLLR